MTCMRVGCGWNKREKVHYVKSLALAILPGYSTSQVYSRHWYSHHASFVLPVLSTEQVEANVRDWSPHAVHALPPVNCLGPERRGMTTCSTSILVGWVWTRSWHFYDHLIRTLTQSCLNTLKPRLQHACTGQATQEDIAKATNFTRKGGGCGRWAARLSEETEDNSHHHLTIRSGEGYPTCRREQLITDVATSVTTSHNPTDHPHHSCMSSGTRHPWETSTSGHLDRHHL